MSAISEMIVLLWLLPVVVNIILPLTLLCLRLIGMLLSFNHKKAEVYAEQQATSELST